MKDRVKKALKRAASGLMAVLLAVCLVGTPRAKAVVSEGALLGSIFGSLLVSMGYSWAAENMDVPGFGEALYKLTQEYDETNKDTGSQLIRDLSLAGLTANGAGKLQFGYAWVQAARSFAEWFEGKFFQNTNTAVVTGGSFQFSAEGDRITVSYPSTATSKVNLSYGKRGITDVYFYPTEPFILSCHQNYPLLQGSSASFSLSGVTVYIGYTPQKWSDSESMWSASTDGLSSDSYISITQDMVDSGVRIQFYFMAEQDFTLTVGGVYPITNACSLSSDNITSLSAEKPQEVHYPDVAEDGSQVYEITVDGVTATDIEGIIQGAVDRILAGTAAIAGSIADVQAGTGEEVANPEIDPYKVGLSSVFPFCIPFDVYNMVTMFVAAPEAPNAEWTFTLPWSGQEYSVGWDLAAFDGVARVCRDMELVLFAVGLAVITYKVIKW